MARWHKVEQFQHFLFRSKNFNPRTFFNSESVKDITSSHTFFRRNSIILRSSYKAVCEVNSALRYFLRYKHLSQQKFVPSPRDRFMNF